MYKSYFKIGFRNLVLNKLFSIINISGLAIGISSAIIIGVWIFNEFNSNREFSNFDQIGMVYHNLDFAGEIITYEGSPYVFGEKLKHNFPEFDNVAMLIGPNDYQISNQDKAFSRSCYFVDTTFSDIFSLNFLQGSSEGLKNPNSILISESLAVDLFGGDSFGKSVEFNKGNFLNVVGVFEDFPQLSKFGGLDMIVPIDYYFSLNEDTKTQRNSWEYMESTCVILKNENISWEEAELKIKNVLLNNSPLSIASLNPESIIHPMNRWNLFSEFKEGENIGGKIQYIRLLGILGIFILFLASINYINLSTAKSENRIREVGVRKVMGSARIQLVIQFFFESFIIVVLAFLLACGLVPLFLPSFNSLIGTNVEFPWSNLYFIVFLVIFIFITSLLSGVYPAFYLSSFSSIKSLKGRVYSGKSSAFFRKSMVIFQFSISTILLIGTWVVFQQIQFTKGRSVGFDLKGIIQIPIKTEEMRKVNYNSLRSDLFATGAIENMAASDFPITGNMSSEPSISWEGKDPSIQSIVAMNKVSHDFSKTNGFEFIYGRDFSRDYTSDSTAVIVNEMAADLFSNAGEVLGKKLIWRDGDEIREKQIIGVIKDQIRWSPFSRQSPHIYFIDYKGVNWLTIKMNSGIPLNDALASIEKVLKKYDPKSPFEYQFQDEDFAKMFKTEERIGKAASIFSILAIYISCMGIFGLSTYASFQRIKEIGIRKVLGATEFSIWKMLSYDFLRLVIIASFIGFPIAYYFCERWLNQYDYRIEIPFLVFIYAIITLMLITILTVSFQSLKAAYNNPIKSIKTD